MVTITLVSAICFGFVYHLLQTSSHSLSVLSARNKLAEQCIKCDFFLTGFRWSQGVPGSFQEFQGHYRVLLWVSINISRVFKCFLGGIESTPGGFRVFRGPSKFFVLGILGRFRVFQGVYEAFQGF